MPVQQLFYHTAVPVNSERHKDWSVRVGESYAFASKVNSVPVTTIEFAQAAAEYPIVFAGGTNSVLPAVILGVQDDQNLFVAHDGAWQAKYIPAFVRRYPFIFSHDEAGETFTSHLDETSESCNQAGSGERLFDARGAQTQYLRSVLGFLQDYERNFRRTQAYCARLVDLDLLQSVEARFKLYTGEQRALSGFSVVDRQKLKALPAEVIADLFSKDELELTFIHLASLQLFRGLPERFHSKPKEADVNATPMAVAEAPGKLSEVVH